MSAQTIRLRIRVVRPPAGVLFCLQRRQTELVNVVMSMGTDLTFEVEMTAQPGAGDKVRLVGPFSQGPPTARFFYLRMGAAAGQMGSPWIRRAKIPLAGITWSLAEKAIQSDGILEAAYEGTAKDGGPIAATVKLTSDWKLGGLADR